MRTKRKVSVLAVTALTVTVVFVLGMARLILLNNVEKNVIQRAINEAAERAAGQAADVDHSLSLQFDTLESLAGYIGEHKSQNFGDLKDLMTSFLTGNKFCVIAYTDIKGNILGAVSADQLLPSGNIADRSYFEKAVYWKDSRAVEYMAKTALTDEPRVLFAVPIITNNVVDGCLFASTEQDFFEEKVMGGTISDGFDLFMINREGMIIADDDDAGLFQDGFNLFESYLTAEDSEKIRNDIQVSGNNSIMIKGADPVVLAYAHTGVPEWTVVCQIDYRTASEKYAHNMEVIRKTVSGITAIFSSGALMFAIIGFVLEKRRSKEWRKLANITRNLDSFLEKSGNATFSYDARNVALHVSRALEKMMEEEIPGNWFSIIPERQKIHPEFDYAGMIRAYSEMVVTGEYREVCSCIRLKDGRNRWLKFSMAPAFDNDGNNSGVVGMVTDISEDYINENVGKEEQGHILQATLSFIPLSVSVNLTRNTYSLLNHVPYYFENLASSGMYSELIDYAAERIPENYRTPFLKALDRDHLLDEFAAGKKSLEIEHPLIVGPESTEKWVVSKLSCLQNDENGDKRMLIMLLDNTQQKKHELLLQKNRDIIVDNMPGFACKWQFTEDDILLIDANSSYYHFLRADEAQVRDHSVFYGLADDEKREMIRELVARKNLKRDIHASIRGVKFDGEEFYIMVNGTYDSMNQGQAVYICVLTDITAIVKMREEQANKAEELRMAADLSETLVIKYDAVSRKIYILANGTEYARVAQLDGHAPEYAVEKGLVPIVDGASFYSTFKAIEKGSPEGAIRFAVNSKNKPYWVCGHYKTAFNENGEPLSAIILLNMESEDKAELVDTSFESFNSSTGNSAAKVLVLNLTQDSIEFESEMDDFSLVQAGIFVFTEAKKRLIEEGRIEDRDQEEWLRFFDSDRLIGRFIEGKKTDHMIFKAETRYGENREVSVDILLQDSQYDGNVRAYVVFKDIQAAENETSENNDIITTERVGEPKVFIHTFGFFEVYVDGKPISFTHDKSKEMLAVLVDRKGGFVSSSEMIGYLWEDEAFNKTTQSRCRQVASRLKKILEDNGIGDIIETVNGRRRIIPEKVDCDYFNYLGNKPEYRHLFNGTYMMNYSWSELTTADLLNSKSIF